MKKNIHGLTFAEIMVAVLIVFVVAMPIVYVTTSSRKDTSRAIFYLRAVELANETLEWATIIDYEDLTDETLQGYTGSITDSSSNGTKCVSLQINSKPKNKQWENNLLTKELKYPDQYAGQYYYRHAKVEELDNGNLKKVTVKVKWAEDKRPKQVDKFDDKGNTDGRDRYVEMSVIILKERAFNLKKS